MLFNIVGNNCDDHAKNFSFIMDKKGKWRLSPAYDLVYSYGEGIYKEHFLTLADKRTGFTLKDVTDIAAKFDISREKALKMVEATNDAFNSFETEAKALGLNMENIAFTYLK